MNKQNVNEILDALAARLSVPASHLWGVLTRQAAIEFWTMVAQAVLVSVIAIIALLAWRAEAAKDNAYLENGRELVLGLVALVASIFAAVLLCAAISQAGYLINPEFYALRTVLGALK